MTETTTNKHAAGSHASATLPRAEPEVVGMSSTRLSRIVTAARRKHLVFHEAVGHLGPDRSSPNRATLCSRLLP
jgi:hypothetical protein